VQKFNPDVFNIPDKTLLAGFFQTDKYFLENQNDVKKWFNIVNDEKTNYILEKFPVEEFCYIHFRGTDYKDWDGGVRFLPKKYYDEAIIKIREIKSDIKLLFITDDINMCKEYFDGYDIISNDMFVDFKLLYNSKYCIISNSTFSWWACWLSEKITIAPYKWLNYNLNTEIWYPYDIKTEKFIYI
jgi:hypothetical protein